MVEDRKLNVLRAIVEDYVSTQEPVGSKALVDRHQLGVSPATVRNDMASLEEEGFITQPHTSAGRIPTDKGYRLFVDRLGGVKPLSAAEKRAITTLLEGAVDLDDVVQRSVRLLAQLTRQVAVVQYPTLSRSTVRHVEVVPLGGSRLLLVLILSTGRVEQRVVELPAALAEDAVAEIRTKVNRAVIGERLADASDKLVAAARGVRAGQPDLDRRAGGLARRGDERPPLRRAGRGGRHRQPGPLRRRLRRQHPADARGARGARGAAQAARRGHVVVDGDGADRAGGPLPGAGHHLGRGHRLRPRRRGPRDARHRRARPGWTTRDPWRRCARSRATSAGSSTKDDLGAQPPTTDPAPTRVDDIELREHVSQDLYETLGVSRDADGDTIKKAYRKLARQLHPDVNPDPETQERFKDVSRAYEVLSDPEKRRMYDLGGDPFNGAGGGFAGAGQGFSFTDIMDAFFGGAAGGAAGGGRGPRPRVRRGQDALIRLEVDLAEAAFGTTRELKVDTAVLCTLCQGSGAAPGSSPQTCETCHGRGETVHAAALVPRRDPHHAALRGLPRLRHDHPRAVPRVLRRRPGPLAPQPQPSRSRPASTAGTRVQLSGQGEVGPGGGPAGDLYVEMRRRRPPGVRPARQATCTARSRSR